MLVLKDCWQTPARLLLTLLLRLLPNLVKVLSRPHEWSSVQVLYYENMVFIAQLPLCICSLFSFYPHATKHRSIDAKKAFCRASNIHRKQSSEDKCPLCSCALLTRNRGLCNGRLFPEAILLAVSRRHWICSSTVRIRSRQSTAPCSVLLIGNINERFYARTHLPVITYGGFNPAYKGNYQVLYVFLYVFMSDFLKFNTDGSPTLPHGHSLSWSSLE